jgi:putative ABC transport system permease protein
MNVHSLEGFLMARYHMLFSLSVSMLIHGKLKTIGALAGILFAILLAGQQLAALAGATYQAELFQAKANPDLWILPQGVKLLGEGRPLPETIRPRVLAIEEVKSVEPVVFGASEVLGENAKRESVTVVGIDRDAEGVGPWNLVSGDREALHLPHAVIVEDSFRERTGSTNVGSIREIGGHEIRVVGTTWGMISWAPQFAWTNPQTARQILGMPERDVSFFVVRLKNPEKATEVAEELQRMLPEVEVLTHPAYSARVHHYVLVDAGAGAILLVSAVVGLFVGLVIVSLMMYTSVNDSIREYGAMKAIGAGNWDLAVLVMMQGLLLGIVGSLIGGAVISWIPTMMRAPNVIMIMDMGTVVKLCLLMIVICIVASFASVIRLRKLEPAMIFR